MPPQSSLLNSPIDTMRTTSGYFSPKSIIAPALRASAIGMFGQPIGSPVQDLLVHLVSICGKFLVRRRPTGLAKSNRSRSSSTFEPCCRACSPRMLSQGVVQQVRGRVGAADALPPLGIDPGGDRVAQLDPAFAQMAAVQREAAVDLRVDHLEAEARRRRVSPVSPTWPPISP